MKQTRRQVLKAGTAGAAMAVAGLPLIGARAADDYPNKPIKLILPAAPGGPTDAPARIASQILQAKLGQPVVVENRPGAGGALGARAVASAPADGYTLLVGNTSVLSVIPAVSSKAGYDPVKDFVPIVKLTEGFLILVVLPSSPWKTVAEFVSDSKANPSKISYGHTGAGGIPHMAGEVFMLRSGARLTGVPYRSGGESITGVLSGAVHAAFEGVGIVRPLLNDGKLRALGAQTGSRTPLLPGVPTMAELGIPNCEANTFYGVVAPAGTPASIVKKISVALNEGLKTPEVQTMVGNLASEAKPNTPEEFSAFIATQYRKWVEVGKAANVKVN
jgi:tripartite-type tricarboxylate transporter receptor subunit TctC